MKLATEFIPLSDGTHICAPSNITLMSSYVLREQGDWFEDEIHFIRKFVKPGMFALDIGANYGLYATAIAKHMGPKGRLWCFEPTPNTAEALRQTFKKNKFRGKVKVVEAGLSDHSGSATFFMSPNAELNTLAPSDESFLQEQKIDLLTLDDYARDAKITKMDFVKLDAEGEEVRILSGGQRFFTEFSPVVMFELMHVEKVNVDLLASFSSLDYAFYYLIPGLNVLAPYEPGSKVDRYLLNLFAMKSDRHEALKAAGLMVDRRVVEIDAPEVYSVHNVLARLTDELSEPARDSSLAKILSLLVVARSVKLEKQLRFDSLNRAYELICGLSVAEMTPELLSSAARVAFDIGQREFGVQLLERFVLDFLKSGKSPEITELYFPPGKHHDKNDLALKRTQSFCAMMIDEYIRKVHRSGYFAGDSLGPYFKALRALDALSPEMVNRERVAHARGAAMRR